MEFFMGIRLSFSWAKRESRWTLMIAALIVAVGEKRRIYPHCLTFGAGSLSAMRRKRYTEI
jgi:hypothetical protein